jgi:hypothetical protein
MNAITEYYNEVVLYKKGGSAPTDYNNHWNFLDIDNRLVDVVNGATLTNTDAGVTYVAGRKGSDVSAYNADRSFFFAIDTPIQLVGKTFSMWVKQPIAQGYTVLLGTNYNAYDPLAIVVDTFSMQQNSWISFGDTFSTTDYHLVTARFGTTTLDIFFDGVLTYAQTGLDPAWNALYANAFGHYAQSGGLALLGMLADIKVWYRELTDEEIMAIKIDG